eukprot:scaffold265931_cov29-Tisochrysis_lutea.AAC.3
MTNQCSTGPALSLWRFNACPTRRALTVLHRCLSSRANTPRTMRLRCADTPPLPSTQTRYPYGQREPLRGGLCRAVARGRPGGCPRRNHAARSCRDAGRGGKGD